MTSRTGQMRTDSPGPGDLERGAGDARVLAHRGERCLAVDLEAAVAS